MKRGALASDPVSGFLQQRFGDLVGCSHGSVTMTREHHAVDVAGTSHKLDNMTGDLQGRPLGEADGVEAGDDELGEDADVYQAERVAQAVGDQLIAIGGVSLEPRP